MQLRLIIPKVPPVKLVHSDVSRTVCETLSFLSFSLPSTRVREKHRGGRRRGAFQRERQKDPQTPNHLLQSPAAGSEQEVPANPVFGSAGESRARRVTGAHANTGMCFYALSIK